jgi:mitosis inhibitor protein kinase SWE1
VTARHPPISGPRPLHHRRSSSIPSPEKQQGRFEREFEEVDEIGSGAFGKVMKVKRKIAGSGEAEGEVFAVKKSKRFEGIRHR